MRFVQNDGGRAECRDRGLLRDFELTTNPGDCMARAFSIAMHRPYDDVYRELAMVNLLSNPKKAHGKHRACFGRRTVDYGVFTDTPGFSRWLAACGWERVSTWSVSSGPKMYLANWSVPRRGSFVLSLRRHVVAVVNGTLHDTYDFRGTTAEPVFGYWRKINE